ncbi:hypothetical protein [Bifidobacterium eulemuris]|uniref:Uncharacterized protein n=1 Tax=Bifidobacterium eulemuris TaxID=1765219 RepID=A0A261GA01_9BIFI|nr:hypothetical protein [Bifidobacterium eulemuris]OZG68257.1 hypothetical protein BEUL_1270 [Bifidobacterium eulemuris]QOL31687.1 hypothetical protein BE0216_03840 [Bifidobacterium eulemuris]
MVVKTGFWVNPGNTRVLWARDNGSDKRSELWELFDNFDSYEWRDVRGALTNELKEYGFAGYLAVLRSQGWSCVQQPDGFSKQFQALPKLPFPDALLSGSTCESGGWTYLAAEIVQPSADTVAYEVPARWVIDVNDVVGDISDVGRLRGAPDAAVVVEPEPVTAEIPEVPPTVNGRAAVRCTVPAMIPAKELPQLAGLKRPKHFRDARGRKLVYVAHDDGRCVVAWRETYTGGDAELEARVADYVRSIGFELGA